MWDPHQQGSYVPVPFSSMPLPQIQQQQQPPQLQTTIAPPLHPQFQSTAAAPLPSLLPFVAQQELPPSLLPLGTQQPLYQQSNHQQLPPSSPPALLQASDPHQRPQHSLSFVPQQQQQTFIVVVAAPPATERMPLLPLHSQPLQLHPRSPNFHPQLPSQPPQQQNNHPPPPNHSDHHCGDVAPDSYNPEAATQYLVNGVHKRVTSELLADFLRSYRPLRVHVAGEKSGRVRGFAYVDFATPADARRAVAEKSGQYLFGKQIKIHVSKREAQTPTRAQGCTESTN